MATPPDSLSVDELLAHSQRLGTLASRLASDADGAEDLVQETWLRALQDPPRRRRALGAWLSRVLTNRARDRHRDEGRRRLREEARGGELAGKIPATDELIERLDTHRVLVEELMQLDEPYRTTILLVYFENLSPSTVARSQGIPAGTVRWRLKHGLDQMRARLDGRFRGERSSWVLACTSLARRGSEDASLGHGIHWYGAIVMSNGLKLGLGALALAVATFVVWKVGPPGDYTAIGGVDPEEAQESGLAGRITEPDGGSHEEPEERRPALVDLPSEAASGPGPDPAEGGESLALLARFVDTAGIPLPGVRLGFADDQYKDLGHALSGPDGRVELRVDWTDTEATKYLAWGELDFVCLREGMALHDLRVALHRESAAQVGDVVLEPECTVRGRVVDAAGAPVPGQLVFASPSIRAFYASLSDEGGSIADFKRLGHYARIGPSAVTAADGSFLLVNVPPGHRRIWSGGGESRYAYSRLLRAESGGALDGIVLVIRGFAPEDLIEGVVLDPDSHPMPGVSVSAGFEIRRQGGSGSSATSVLTDAEGRFRFVVKAHVPHDLAVGDPEATWPALLRDGVEPGTRDLVLQFEASRTVHIRVVDAEGAAVEEFDVFSADPETPEERKGALDYFNSGYRGASGIHPGGQTEVIVPAERFDLRINARGYEQLLLGPLQLGGITEPLVCTLRPLPAIRGRVHAGGIPVEGADVELLAVPNPGRSLTRDGMPCVVLPNPIYRDKSDASGRFLAYWDVNGGTGRANQSLGRFREDVLRVRVSVEGHAPALLEETSLASLVENELDIELTPGGRLAGRVLTDAGHSPVGIIVGITNGDGHPRSSAVGEDGAFEFEHLTPGGWLVARLDREIVEGGHTGGSGKTEGTYVLPVSCLVEEGRLTRHDLDLRGSICKVEGSLAIGGADPTGWRVRMSELDPVGGEGQNEYVLLDPRGRFSCELRRNSRYSLRIDAYEFDLSDRDGRRISDVLITNGETLEWELELETGTLSASGASGDGVPLLHRFQGVGELAVLTPLLVDDEGRVAPTQVPAGRGCIVQGRLARGDSSELPVLADVEVERGGLKHVDL